MIVAGVLHGVGLVLSGVLDLASEGVSGRCSDPSIFFNN
jgi:hypothetical protein